MQQRHCKQHLGCMDWTDSSMYWKICQPSKGLLAEKPSAAKLDIVVTHTMHMYGYILYIVCLHKRPYFCTKWPQSAPATGSKYQKKDKLCAKKEVVNFQTLRESTDKFSKEIKFPNFCISLKMSLTFWILQSTSF